MTTKLKALLVFTAIAMALISAVPAVMAMENTEDAVMVTKTMTLDRQIGFNADDFTQNLKKGEKLSGIFITSVPDRSEGMLLLSGEVVESGQAVLASAIEDMIFFPLSEGEITTRFECIPILKNGSAGSAVQVKLNLLNEDNAPPESEDSETETRSGMRISGMLRASDPEGSELTFYIRDKPDKGEVVLDKRSGVFTYTPFIGKTGNDSFTFYASDQYGNISDNARVRIKIGRSGKIEYADMKGHYAHFPAVRLAEEGIISGESIGSVNFFHPNRPVARGEFVAMLLTTAGLDKNMPLVLSTGLFDDDSIPAWAKPYVTQAIDAGIFSGTTNSQGYRVADANRTITRGEAAVIVDALLEEKTGVFAVACFSDLDAVPAWAYSAVVNMRNTGIMVGKTDGSLGQNEALTRGQAAVLLYNLMRHQNEAKSGSLLSWARN